LVLAGFARDAEHTDQHDSIRLEAEAQMKKYAWVLGLLLIGVAAVVGTGCKKKAAVVAAPVKDGVTIDLPKLREALATVTNRNSQRTLTMATSGVRYGTLDTALSNLEKLSTDPALNDAQKKVVLEVMEQVKQLAEKQMAAPQ